MERGRGAARTKDLEGSTPANRPPADPLLRIDGRQDDRRSQLAVDVRRGLTQGRKTLPPKYFYDDRGSRLFEAICELPEYYLTRTEHALLQAIAADVIARARPSHLIELGSGGAHKTRALLDALARARPHPWYVPIDVSEHTLRRTAATLRAAYPDLGVHAVIADYEHGVPAVRGAERRLVVFLGSTIGNFVSPADAVFLRTVQSRLQPGDYLLLGVDLVKSVELLHAAYNDRAGVTAEFNRNVLRVINHELDADFDPARFDHVAFFDPQASRIEMHLRARDAHQVRIAALDLTVPFGAGETIHTESSRKYTRASAGAMLRAGGFRLVHWYAAPADAFALALAVVDGVG